MNKEVYDSILSDKIIAIVRGVRTEHIADTMESLLAGGIRNVEITFDYSCDEGYNTTLQNLQIVSAKFGSRINLGAGTVLDVKSVEDAVRAGAEYIISPNTDESVILRTKKLGKISMPGAFSPTEIVAARNMGADIVKVFPAGDLGAGYIKSVFAPLSHIPMAAVGGVTVDNMCEFLAAGVKCVGIGGNLVSAKLTGSGKFEEITRRAREFCSKLI
ncbi:MAG: bifunctional 4-hydroxy-2-oxoglutarate aldolase/2-dehydro-3-deoxy-phosphogluconate aldolase [Eubacteriales bacterium]